MTDAQFYKGFHFNLYRHRQYRTTDLTAPPGCGVHYLARMVQGRAKIVTADRTLHLAAGDVFFIPKGLCYHSYWYPQDGAVQFYSFGFDWFPCDGQSTPVLQKIPCSPAAVQLLAELESDITVSPLSIGRLYRFVGEVCPMLHTEAAAAGETTVHRALEFLRAEPAGCIADAARHCGVSESTLYNHFRRYLGKTPVEARHRILADRAAELLVSSDLRVEEISGRLGFSSPAYFRRIFREQTGVTPTAFRKQAGGI